MFSFNPRNTNINIRGLGSNVALTNDGLENGVGFYIDNVYYGRVGLSQFDLVDLDSIEVLRGPQGTLFGKKTRRRASSTSPAASPASTPNSPPKRASAATGSTRSALRPAPGSCRICWRCACPPR
ncbi:TonB-dependent receptor plug domain-containing protein [Novosphingobium colocasiae]